MEVGDVFFSRTNHINKVVYVYALKGNGLNFYSGVGKAWKSSLWRIEDMTSRWIVRKLKTTTNASTTTGSSGETLPNIT